MKFKKADIKKVDTTKLTELVDGDGGAIDGDEVDNGDSQIKTAPNQTTDDYAESGIQSNDIFLNGGSLTTGVRVRESLSKARMRNIIEDLVKKSTKTDMVKDKKKPQVFKDKIGTIDDLDSSISSKLSALIDSLDKADGDDLAIVLDILIKNTKTKQIPPIKLNKIKDCLK